MAEGLSQEALCVYKQWRRSLASSQQPGDKRCDFLFIPMPCMGSWDHGGGKQRAMVGSCNDNGGRGGGGLLVRAASIHHVDRGDH